MFDLTNSTDFQQIDKVQLNFGIFSVQYSSLILSHQNNLIVLSCVHHKVVALQVLNNLNKLFLIVDKSLICTLTLTLTLIETHVPLPYEVCASLILRVLQAINHLEDKAFLLIIKDWCSTEQLVNLITMVNLGPL